MMHPTFPKPYSWYADTYSQVQWFKRLFLFVQFENGSSHVFKFYGIFMLQVLNILGIFLDFILSL